MIEKNYNLTLKSSIQNEWTLVRFASHVKEGTCFGECPPFLIFVLRRIYAEYFTNGVVICLQGPPPQGGQLKFTIADTLERIKEEFNFLQAQYHT
jgi:hypothetical protein